MIPELNDPYKALIQLGIFKVLMRTKKAMMKTN